MLDEKITPSHFIETVFCHEDKDIWIEKKDHQNSIFMEKRRYVDKSSEIYLPSVNLFLKSCGLPEGSEQLKEDKNGKLKKSSYYALNKKSGRKK